MVARWLDVPRDHVDAVAKRAYPPAGDLVRINYVAGAAGSNTLARAIWDGAVWRHKSGNVVLGVVVQWQALAIEPEAAVGSSA